MRFARDDLASAESIVAEHGRHQPRHACFAAQQAAEKALKAVCIARQLDYPFSHDLEELAALLDPGDAAARASTDLRWLSRWAVQPRYPGEDAEWADADQAVLDARTVVEAAERDARGSL